MLLRCRQTTVRKSNHLVIWVYIGALALATALTWIFDDRHLQPISSPVHLFWPLLACGFALGHFATINVEFRSSSHRLDLTDVDDSAGNHSSPGSFQRLLAAAVGTVIHSDQDPWPAHQGRRLQRHLPLHALSMSIAIACFHAVLGPCVGSVPSPAMAPQVVVRAVFTAVVGSVLRPVSRWSSVSPPAGIWNRCGLTQVAITLPLVFAIDFIFLGLAAIQMLWASLGGGILFIGVAIGVAFAPMPHTAACSSSNGP